MRYLLFALCAIAYLGTKVSGAGVTASSAHSEEYQPEYAADGDRGTRWASTDGMPQWLRIDFGRKIAVGTVVIRWEAAYAKEYELQVSDDGGPWRTVYHNRDGKGGKETLAGLKGEGRYWRVLCTGAGPYGIASIWEIEFPEEHVAKSLAETRGKAPLQTRDELVQSLAKAGVEQIVFAARSSGDDGHWYANFGYYARQVDRKAYGRPGGRLCRLNLATGNVTTLLDDPQGGVRDPVVHYDGKRILFAYRKGGSDHYNLYEINADGAGLRQITSGPWDDFEPVYLPDGGILFVSSRCNRWVNCWLTQVAVLYRCDADGKDIRPLSSNNEHDNTPWVLPDGRILYTRWEYVDRSQVDYHHLWTMNPDGTNQTVYYGNLYPGTVIIDAKPIAGTEKVLATFSPGHGAREHEGPFYVMDPRGGPDDRNRVQRVSGRNGRDPYPIGQQWVLYAAGRSIRLADYAGGDYALYTDRQLEVHEPRPLAPRQRELLMPRRSDPTKATGRLVLADVHIGRSMAGVKPGEIKRLLVLESLPKPINYTGGMDPLTYGGSFTLERIVGTVPVEADGSAYIELPALRSFFFVALDTDGLSVKRMQSFLTVQGGETTGCVGCHEQRTQAAPVSRNLMAMRRPASRIEPIKGVPQVMDFPRDVQPVLDRHCVGCHDYQRHPGIEHGPRAGGVILSGDRGPMFSHSYAELTIRGEFADGRNEARSNRAPRTIGASASRLMKKLNGEHYGVKLSRQEIDLVKYWIETGATYPGTYAALGTGMIGGYYENNQVGTDWDWPQTKAAGEAIGRRCGSCHQGPMSLPRNLSDENGLSFWQPDWRDPRLRKSRHLVFNLSRPEQSLVLLAPLAKSAGGYGLCAKSDGDAVFGGKDDPDYQKLLAMCAAGKGRLDQIKRFDMPGFEPDPAYLRELRRYGVLMGTPTLTGYELDHRYWESLWHRGKP